jgi:hypothetical protein
MRNTIFSFFMLLFGIATAQDAVKRVVLGGTFGMYNHSQSYLQDGGERWHSTSNTVSIVPYIALQANERWLFGLQGGVNLRHFNTTVYDPTLRKTVNKYSSYSVGALARRSFMAGKPLRFFLEPGIRYAWFNRKQINVPPFGPPPIKEAKELSFYATPGISWSVSQHFRVLAKFGNLRYVTGKFKYDEFNEPESISQFDLQMNAETLTVGAEVRF